MSNYTVSVVDNKISINVTPVEYSVALSRTGSQGSKGDSITNITLDSTTDELIFEITDSLGNVSEINAGIILSVSNINDLNDVNTDTIEDGQVIAYQASTASYIPHTLTTTSLVDIDNTGKEDGALFIFDSNTSKYKATTTVQNQNIQIIGGAY